MSQHHDPSRVVQHDGSVARRRNKDLAYVHKIVVCEYCGMLFWFKWLPQEQPSPEAVISQQSHNHGIYTPTTTATLFADGTVEQVSKMPPKQIYVEVLCSDGCACEDWDD